jgi:hypothetical protein
MVLFLFVAFVPPVSLNGILVAAPQMLTVEGFLLALSGRIQHSKTRIGAIGLGFTAVLISLATILHPNLGEFIADSFAFLGLIGIYSRAILREKQESEIQYATETAKTLEESLKLVSQGFDYVANFEGVKLFRKRKQS